MNRFGDSTLVRFIRCPVFGPAWFASRALLIALIYFICELLGWRDFVSILSGTAPTGDPKNIMAITIGVTYILFFFSFTIVAPIFLIASGILALIEFAFKRR